MSPSKTILSNNALLRLLLIVVVLARVAESSRLVRRATGTSSSGARRLRGDASEGAPPPPHHPPHAGKASKAPKSKSEGASDSEQSSVAYMASEKPTVELALDSLEELLGVSFTLPDPAEEPAESDVEEEDNFDRASFENSMSFDLEWEMMEEPSRKAPTFTDEEEEGSFESFEYYSMSLDLEPTVTTVAATTAASSAASTTTATTSSSTTAATTTTTAATTATATATEPTEEPVETTTVPASEETSETLPRDSSSVAFRSGTASDQSDEGGSVAPIVAGLVCVAVAVVAGLALFLAMRRRRATKVTN